MYATNTRGVTVKTKWNDALNLGIMREAMDSVAHVPPSKEVTQRFHEIAERLKYKQRYSNVTNRREVL